MKRFLMGAWVGVGGIRRTRRPDEMVGQSQYFETETRIGNLNEK